MRTMSDFKPYMVKAVYDWIISNGLTPQIIVNTTLSGVDVPEEYLGKPGNTNHKILLSLGLNATAGIAFDLKQGLVTFYAQFAGSPHFVRIPLVAVESMHAKENGEGTVFKVDHSKPKHEAPQERKTILKLVKQ